MARPTAKGTQGRGKRLCSKCAVVKDKFYDVFKERCDSALEKIGLHPENEPVPLLGSRPLDGLSTSACTSRIHKFVSFCIVEGYDESLLPFYPFTPKGTVSAEERAMVAFLHTMFTPIDEPVVDMHDNPIVNPSGKQIRGLGLWKDPEIMDGLRTAVTHALSNTHGHGETFWEPCQNCKNAAAKNDFSGCQHHSPARLVRIGNVMNSVKVRDTIDCTRSNSSHVVRGACHLLPSHARLMREFAMSSNDIFWFQIYRLKIR